MVAMSGQAQALGALAGAFENSFNVDGAVRKQGSVIVDFFHEVAHSAQPNPPSVNLKNNLSLFSLYYSWCKLQS